MNITLVSHAELSQFPELASRLKSFHTLTEVATALPQLQDLNAYLHANKMCLERDLLDDLTRTLIALPPPSDTDEMSTLLQTVVPLLQIVALLNRNSSRNLVVGAALLAQQAVEQQSLAWFELLGRHHPEAVLVKVLTNDSSFGSWVSDPQTTDETLKKIAEFLVQTSSIDTGNKETGFVIPLDQICTANPKVIGEVCTPEFLTSLGDLRLRQAPAKRAVSNLVRAGLLHIASGVADIDSTIAAPAVKPKI